MSEIESIDVLEIMAGEMPDGSPVAHATVRFHFAPERSRVNGDRIEVKALFPAPSDLGILALQRLAVETAYRLIGKAAEAEIPRLHALLDQARKEVVLTIPGEAN